MKMDRPKLQNLLNQNIWEESCSLKNPNQSQIDRVDFKEDFKEDLKEDRAILINHKVK